MSPPLNSPSVIRGMFQSGYSSPVAIPSGSIASGQIGFLGQVQLASGMIWSGGIPAGQVGFPCVKGLKELLEEVRPANGVPAPIAADWLEEHGWTELAAVMRTLPD